MGHFGLWSYEGTFYLTTIADGRFGGNYRKFPQIGPLTKGRLLSNTNAAFTGINMGMRSNFCSRTDIDSVFAGNDYCPWADICICIDSNQSTTIALNDDIRSNLCSGGSFNV